MEKLSAKNKAAVFWSAPQITGNPHGFGLWILHQQSDNDFVGYGGIRHATLEGRDVIELAYAITTDHWRKGFATEISRAALKHGFDTMHLERIVAFTLPHNKASRAVMEHCGFTYNRDIVHANPPPRPLYSGSSLKPCLGSVCLVGSPACTLYTGAEAGIGIRMEPAESRKEPSQARN